jgi:folate-binding protein YgfZ
MSSSDPSTPHRTDGLSSQAPGGVAAGRAVRQLDGCLRLRDWGLIVAAGADSATFLHGQLTQDMAHLDTGVWRPAGYCSAKGRLLATFLAWRTGPETLALACSADLLAPTLKRLSMFVLRAKCKLVDASATTALHGLAGASVAAWCGPGVALPEPGRCLARGEAWLLRLADADGVPRALLAQPAGAQPPAGPGLTADDWAWLEVRSGVARVCAATAEQFVPQMVNLELTGGVNFQKGCYPGQEVVARSQYRGTLKRRMHLVDADAVVVPGAEVFHSADPCQPAGLVVLAAPAPQGGWSALVELKTSLAQAPGELRAGAAMLRLGALPYALPAEAAA